MAAVLVIFLQPLHWANSIYIRMISLSKKVIYLKFNVIKNKPRQPNKAAVTKQYSPHVASSFQLSSCFELNIICFYSFLTVVNADVFGKQLHILLSHHGIQPAEIPILKTHAIVKGQL